jgi:hypothetical protein
MEAGSQPDAPIRARTAFVDVDPDALEGERIHRFVMGIDDGVREMSDEDIADELNDPFGLLVLRKGVFPTTLKEILDSLDAEVPEGEPLRTQMTFLVGEGSQILFSEETHNLPRGLRLAVTRGIPSEIDVMVSTDASGLSDDFLQVIGWDDQQGVFHYYERKGDKWIWAGNSTHALDPDSRGNGPFDSHVNGGLVMKELKPPWIHWQSQDASVPFETFDPDDPIVSDPLLTENLSGAEVFQFRIVQPGIRRWTDSRFAKTVADDGSVGQARALMEQLFVTTTVNLVSTPVRSKVVTPDQPLTLPASFFYDVDTLSGPPLKLPAPPSGSPAISGARYLAALENFEYALVDESSDFSQAGDTFFAFLVPERAFEDIDVVRKCFQVGLLSDRFIASALMVDFPNPVFSEKRASLLRHVPETVTAPETLEAKVVEAIEAAAGDAPGGAEEGFLAAWRLEAGWRAEVEDRLEAFFAALAARLDTDEGVDDLMRLAESRRNRVRPLDLAESRRLLFATTNIGSDSPELEMLPDATVREKSA